MSKKNPYEDIHQKNCECQVGQAKFMAGVYANGKIEIAANRDIIRAAGVEPEAEIQICDHTFTVKSVERSAYVPSMSVIILTA